MTESLCQVPWGNDGGWPLLCGQERPCPDHDQPATLTADTLLHRWADDLDAAPAADPSPDEPVTLFAVLSTGDDALVDDAAYARELAADLAQQDPTAGYRAYRLVPLDADPGPGVYRLPAER